MTPLKLQEWIMIKMHYKMKMVLIKMIRIKTMNTIVKVMKNSESDEEFELILMKINLSLMTTQELQQHQRP